jgi:BirA family biotin operon repressor/biotin-[acetyl-CoA-carboxylase] ligase
MDKEQVKEKLSRLALGGIRYFDTADSTNSQALAWASQGAPDLSLVIADEQIKGRGRMDNQWFTPPNSALAMSLIMRPTADERRFPSRVTGLLAVSLAESLRKLGLTPQIKWPNDLLLNGRKVAGILVEAIWLGHELEAFIPGLGVNVSRDSVPPEERISYPATSVDGELGYPVDRVELLADILTRILAWRPLLRTKTFLQAWEKDLAFLDQQVQVEENGGNFILGKLVGLESDGGLHLIDEYGKSIVICFGEVHLRPVA